MWSLFTSVTKGEDIDEVVTEEKGNWRSGNVHVNGTMTIRE